MRFEIIKNDESTKARAGLLFTDYGEIETPIFMPVGTQGTIKAVPQRIVRDEINAPIILANTYHLYLRPGEEILNQAGGLHNFMSWDKSILTDSGGFQVFSLSDLRKINDEGVEFRSHLDGSKHFFSPRKVIEIQRNIGSDIMMPLDECTPYPCDYEYAKKSKELTSAWALMNKETFDRTFPLYGYQQYLFGIVQGSTYKDLREQSINDLLALDFDGYAIGGLAVGEPVADMYEITEFSTDRIPENKPRYLMGVGRPENILESIERGIDMFDCVMPTRNARNAYLFTADGIITMRNSIYKNDFTPVDESCNCYTCQKFSRAYLRHLFNAREILAYELATIHNLTFYLELVREARKNIIQGTFSTWKNKIIHKLVNNIKEEV